MLESEPPLRSPLRVQLFQVGSIANATPPPALLPIGRLSDVDALLLVESVPEPEYPRLLRRCHQLHVQVGTLTTPRLATNSLDLDVEVTREALLRLHVVIELREHQRPLLRRHARPLRIVLCVGSGLPVAFQRLVEAVVQQRRTPVRFGRVPCAFPRSFVLLGLAASTQRNRQAGQQSSYRISTSHPNLPVSSARECGEHVVDGRIAAPVRSMLPTRILRCNPGNAPRPPTSASVNPP